MRDRIEKLQRHLRTRRGRRDLQALNRLVDIKHGYKKGATLRSLDHILKCYYPDDTILNALSYVPPMFSVLSKIKTDENCPRDRFYVYYEQELKAALAHADEQDAVAATMKFCPTEEEIAAHRKKPDQ